MDDAEVGTPGSCKVESWGSAADNRDVNLVTAPSCVFNLGRPIEFGAQFSRFREGGEWGTEMELEGKIQLFESGKLSMALKGGAGFDLIAGQHSELFAVVPLTYEFSEQFKLNLNAGWSWDRIADQHFFTWGGQVEWKPLDKITLLAEVFGEAGTDANKPGIQAGLRYTPLPAFDIDFVYGRNITGEDANWFSLGVNVRFDAVERRNGRNGNDRD